MLIQYGSIDFVVGFVIDFFFPMVLVNEISEMIFLVVRYDIPTVISLFKDIITKLCTRRFKERVLLCKESKVHRKNAFTLRSGGCYYCMDPRKQKGVSSASKGRGRGSRPIRPQVQSQHAPYIPQMSPQPPIENEEEVQEVEEMPKRRHPNKLEKKSWTPVEESALAKAWVQISTCRIVGNEQSSNSFWKRVHEHFKLNVQDTPRTFHGLNTKWKTMHGAMGVFNGLIIQQNRLRESGCNDVDIMKNALKDYKNKTGKTFTHLEAWEVVRNEAKWLEQPDVAQGSSSHSDKRRKSSESGHYETASTENTVIPDLNDDTIPRIQKRKGKKAESESSTKGSVAASFDTYTARKTQLMEAMVETKVAKEQMAEKLMATQIRAIEEKAMFRALKFFKEPHDNITDPNILAITLAKKREIGEKYG